MLTTQSAPRATSSFLAGRWVPVGIAAAAMVATLPGRTHGLGLITEPLMKDLGLERVPFAALNFWATLVGAAVLPANRLGDRPHRRAAFPRDRPDRPRCGCSGHVPHPAWRGNRGAGHAGILLRRPDGMVSRTARSLPSRPFDPRSRPVALSVVSLALVGKVAGRKPGVAIGVYSFLVALGFMGAFAA